jgi:hypothetical protein
MGRDQGLGLRLVQRGDEVGGTQGQEEVGLGLRGLPERVELGVLELDQALAGLKELGEGGLVLLKEAIELILHGATASFNIASVLSGTITFWPCRTSEAKWRLEPQQRDTRAHASGSLWSFTRFR